MNTKQAYRTHCLMYWLCILLALLTVPANALEIPPKPPSHVVDLADVIEASHEAKINRHLFDLGKKNIATIVVLTVDTTDDESIDEYSLRIANDKWQLGDKEKNNGLLILVAVKDCRWRIEVGLGLEEILPNDFCRDVGQQYFVPNFRAGKFGKGIYEGTLALVNKVTRHYDAEKRDRTIKWYTCSMHPQIQIEKAAKCPICLMELIPVYGSEDEHVSISEGGLQEFCEAYITEAMADIEKQRAYNAWTIVGSYVDIYGKGCIERLREILKSPSLEWVAAAAHHLGQMGDEKSIPTLKHLLASERLQLPKMIFKCDNHQEATHHEPGRCPECQTELS